MAGMRYPSHKIRRIYNSPTKNIENIYYILKVKIQNIMVIKNHI